MNGQDCDDDGDDHLNDDDDDDDDGYCLGLPRATHTRLIFLPKANIFLKTSQEQIEAILGVGWVGSRKSYLKSRGQYFPQEVDKRYI